MRDESPFNLDYDGNPWKGAAAFVSLMAVLVGIGAAIGWLVQHAPLAEPAFTVVLLLFALAVPIAALGAWCVRAYRWTRDWWRGRLPVDVD